MKDVIKQLQSVVIPFSFSSNIWTMKSRAQSQSFFPINFQDAVKEKDWDIRMCLSSCQRGLSFHSSPNSFPCAEADTATQGLFNLFFIEQRSKWFYLPKRELNGRQIKDLVSLLLFFFLVLHYYSRIIFILIVVIFYFKNLKSGSLSVHWTLVSDTNSQCSERCQQHLHAGSLSTGHPPVAQLQSPEENDQP